MAWLRTLPTLKNSNRGIKDCSGQRVYCYMGDGECDEPESLGAIGLASREGLDNLTFVINCNLQRLDGPVRRSARCPPTDWSARCPSQHRRSLWKRWTHLFPNHNLHAHIGEYTEEVHWLESKFGSVVDAYEAKDKSLKTDALIEYWEEVDFHSAIETQYVPIYASIWQGIYGVKVAIDAAP